MIANEIHKGQSGGTQRDLPNSTKTSSYYREQIKIYALTYMYIYTSIHTQICQGELRQKSLRSKCVYKISLGMLGVRSEHEDI